MFRILFIKIIFISPIICVIQFYKCGGELVGDMCGKLMSDEAIRFYLYTISNPGTADEIFLNNASRLNSTNFNASKATKIITHGWKADYTTISVRPIKHAYLAATDYNVILVDWKQLANKNYAMSRTHITHVGQTVAKLIDFLVINTGVNPKQIHLIGHSLGAHICGIAARTAAARVARVTGLDPAAPLIDPRKMDVLKMDDADFVDVLHTDGGQLGMIIPIGQVDFYANGGKSPQPGCKLFDMLIFGACSHMRAPIYFAETIMNPNCMIATKCSSLDNFFKNNCEGQAVPMGEGCPINITGTYYFQTRNLSPFGMGNVTQSYNELD